MNTKRKRSKHKIPFKCANCGKVKMIAPCRAKTKKFCDNDCKAAFQTGIPKSDETKRKISEAKGGVRKEKRTCEGCGIEFEVEKWKKNRFHSRECSMRHIGKQSHKPWNKGLDISDPRLKMVADKHAETLKNRYRLGEIETWNKGLTKETDNRVAAGVTKLTELRNTDGEWKDAWRKAMSKGQVLAHAAGKYPHTFTKPERQTWAYLESIGCVVKAYADKSDDDPINIWYHQYPFFDTFVPDFACPDLKCIIEADGCAYHFHDPSKCSKPEAKYGWAKFAAENAKKDRKKHWFYHNKGWKWANVWECEADVGDFHRLEQYLEI